MLSNAVQSQANDGANPPTASALGDSAISGRWGSNLPATEEQRRQLARDYTGLLQGYTPRLATEILARASQFGQRALALGCGPAELLRFHHDAIAALPADDVENLDTQTATEILLRALAPCEEGYRELLMANAKHRYRLLLQHKRLRAFTAARQNLQAAIAEHAENETALREQIAQQEQRFTQLVVLQEELKKFCTQVLMLHESEQKRLSQELERSVGGWLDIVEGTLAAVARDTKNSSCRQQLAGPRRQLRRAARTVRQLAAELHPPVLDNMSLAFGLRECLTAFQERTGAAGVFHCRGNFRRVDAPCRLILYRVAREIFNAPPLSGKTKSVDMTLHQLDGSLEMQVNLTGSAPANPAPPRPPTAAGQFLLLQERVRLLNGQLIADTDSGNTARIRVTLPLASAARDPRG